MSSWRRISSDPLKQQQHVSQCLCAHIVTCPLVQLPIIINFHQLPDNVGAQVLTVLAEVLVKTDVACQVLVIRVHLNSNFLSLRTGSLSNGPLLFSRH